ncbi:tRNA (adenine(58)-N(1))-methyltransferase, mitochondrial isoform X1 [Oryzias melastigma]|uniref:tRNA (adenine(58)-N(1))-methyltransferase n=1 Tax=Oryzias melastigma TaxID=30732 RepID=A0A3B3DBE4_ORYME|nr:tRNA (adenine(58)-N(1))-methyltransferase, mitochondrial isoform X1 [Oryzias melastigma]
MFLRFPCVHRLVSDCMLTPAHNKRRVLLVKLSKSCTVRCNSDEGQTNPPHPGSEQASRQSLLSRRRRHLSPLERISSLLPQEVLSPEVEQLREQTRQEQDGDARRDFTQEKSEAGTVSKLEDLETHVASDAAEVPNTHEEDILPGESFLNFGELVIAEYRKKIRVEFRKMFQLEAGSRLQSSWGIILHDDIAGQPAGCFLKTSRGVSISIRRASLEDYVLYMKRGPAIAYPKDAANMLMMMDVAEGDCVLESGSGSGAMSLFLSRAVGSKGSVLSLEVRKDHHRRAILNYERWRKSWSLHRGQQWPDNVEFHNADLCTASPLLSGRAFNAIALDMIRPHLALPTVLPHLYPGAVCAVYLANITQVIDLLEGLRCRTLPVLCERIVEMPARDWLVAPALQKDGQFHTKQAPTPDEDETDRETEENTYDGGSPPFGSVPYIARPHPEQMSHTAFLVKLRKYRH